MEKIKHILDTDPRKHLRQTNDPEHLINRKGLSKQTPLYIAIKNGNYEVVKYLLERGASPFLTSEVGVRQEENNLTVAV